MKITATPLEGLLVIQPRVFEDPRGYFIETHHGLRYQECGIDQSFVQDNLSFSVQGTLRGLHFQIAKPQAKIVQALTGEIFDVAVDIRPESSSFGKWFGIHLSEQNKTQLYIPQGFAHGFCVLSENAHFSYKCSNYYDPQDEGGILWSDRTIGIDWPVKDPILSVKDSRFPFLADLAPEQLYQPTRKK
ncbi:MAG: dTDP-4-dehydrorhamnose 3,5-epimerase [Deltaproteobacteria bacterium]|nr:dTDP-4-dehydrorhamnose 3,5-epimerase [Deltaproteobacteria bacterium]